MTQIVLIRHAKTKGNLTRKYVGRTDEPLCEEGKKELSRSIDSGIYPPRMEGCVLLVSPMKRCRETAEMIYPGVEQRVVDSFRECDFGVFEYRNHQELDGRPDYQAWIDSGGRMKFPEGEDPERFRTRSVKAFEELLQEYPDTPQLILVVHGGTVMSLMSALADPPAGYFDHCVDNGHGYICETAAGGRIRLVGTI